MTRRWWQGLIALLWAVLPGVRFQYSRSLGPFACPHDNALRPQRPAEWLDEPRGRHVVHVVAGSVHADHRDRLVAASAQAGWHRLCAAGNVLRGHDRDLPDFRWADRVQHIAAAAESCARHGRHGDCQYLRSSSSHLISNRGTTLPEAGVIAEETHSSPLWTLFFAVLLLAKYAWQCWSQFLCALDFDPALHFVRGHHCNGGKRFPLQIPPLGN